jgi:hypothetical protein
MITNFISAIYDHFVYSIFLSGGAIDKHVKLPIGENTSQNLVYTDETQMAETQPAETQPAETQPAETQPAETQPAVSEAEEDQCLSDSVVEHEAVYPCITEGTICHNLTRTCHNLTRICHNLTRTCHNLT